MLWDPGSVKKDGEEKEQGDVPVTPILVPLQKNPRHIEESVPVLIPDVKDLKDQFQQQQNMLSQIKETLKQNESKLSSKEKQVEVYANKLSQIRARTRNSQSKKSEIMGNPSSSPKSLMKKSSKENLTKIENNAPDNNSKAGRKGKISELKKCLEENKIKFEQRTGKEQSENKKIESLVEQLKTQLEERDKTIQELQESIEQPKPEAPLRKAKQKFEKGSVASKITQTNQIQFLEDVQEVIELKKKIYDLETQVLDLEENLKEKELVIEARTQAVTLLSKDMSLKGKNTLESLEETRQEMRAMQNNFIVIEDQLKKDLVEKENRSTDLEEKCKKLESTNFDLSLKNAELQEKLVNLQEKYFRSEEEIKVLKESTSQNQTDAKIEELTKKINVLTKELDDRNKSMIKMKIEHKNKIKNLNQTLETLKGASDDKVEIARLNNLLEEFENVKVSLENRVAELEDEKGNLLLSVLDVDDLKVTEKKLKDQINELEIIIQKQNEDLSLHLKTISNLEIENLNLIESSNRQKLIIEELNNKIKMAENGVQEEVRFQELCKKIEKMEEDHIKKVEDLRTEHSKEIEMLESYYNAKVENIDRKELEEYRISAEMNNIHVEEQIELLIREKQQLLEKLKSLSGVSSTDSLNFEKMEHSDLKDDKDTTLQPEGIVAGENENRISHLQRIVNDQQVLITNLQESVALEQNKSLSFQLKITELEEAAKNLEDANTSLKEQIDKTESIESGKNQKSNFNVKNRIKKIEMELSQSKKIIEEQNEKLSELNLKLQEKEELIKKYTEKIELFEKDDWDRQNHWKNNEDDIESFEELQKKCLSLENSLIEVNEDCERLRKENIEVVHLLSEEKVKRRKLLEQLQTKPDSKIEKRIKFLGETVRDLEEKVEKLELHSCYSDVDGGTKQSNFSEVEDLRGKLEWANVVLTGKDTEIFRLQNLIEDYSKSIENLQSDLSDYKIKLEEKDEKLKEVHNELKAKENQLEEISVNFDKLQECVDVANQKTAVNESQLKDLLATVKKMEEDVFKKESELQEIKGILAEKNLDMTNLRNRLEEVNSDLTYSYQEHLENMGKCLRDKEAEYEALLAEKQQLEEIHSALVAEKQDIYNQKVEVVKEKENLQTSLKEKELLIQDMSEKLKSMQKSHGEKDKSQEMEEMKIKMKKLAANLKKKAQNEADLLNQIKELESSTSEKMKSEEELKEKLEMEKKENLRMQKDLSDVSKLKTVLENEKAVMNEKLESFEKQLENLKSDRVTKEEEIKKLKEALNRTQKQLEEKEVELSRLYQAAQESQNKEKERINSTETILQQLANITGKYEKVKFDLNQIILEKSNLEKQLKEMEELAASKSSLDAKIQENFAVIENLESELTKARDQLKIVEEKLFHSEERRLSLENKNQEMCRKMMEDSETLYTIEDLSARVDELLGSEKSLQESVNALESGNSELKQTLDNVLSEKLRLEGELKLSCDKVSEMSNELKQSKEIEIEKCNLIRDLSKEVERLKAENSQILSEFQKLNKDYEQFETDFKENLDNSQAVEKLLKHKIEELTNENLNLSEKYAALSEEKNNSTTGEDKKRKKRKSVTFRTDEVEYIKDLKNQLHDYDSKLKKANQEIENFKADLLREKLRDEVTKVVEEAQKKVENLKSLDEKEKEAPAANTFISSSEVKPKQTESGELKFDADVFFKTESSSLLVENPTKFTEDFQSPEVDSLMWDDGWGTDGHLEEEYLTGRAAESEHKLLENSKVESLEMEIVKLQKETERLSKELQDQTTKYAKAIKKLKEMKVSKEQLEMELNKVKSDSGFGGLDAAIVDELKSQIKTLEAKEKETLKSLESLKSEKESLMKKIDVLSVGNEKFLEMKERQDNEAELWQQQKNELLKEISELRQQINEPLIPEDNHLMQENRDLKNKIEALEWKNCELNELLEEKQELLEGRAAMQPESENAVKEKCLLQKEIDELQNEKKLLEQKLMEKEKESSGTIGELNEQLSVLTSEKIALEEVLGERKKSNSGENEKSGLKIFDYFKSTPENDIFFVESKTPNSESETLRKRISELEELLKVQNDEKYKSFQEKISQLENVIRTQQEQVDLALEKEKKMELVEQKLIELESSSKSKEEEVLLITNQEKEGLRRKFLELESEKVNEIAGLRQNIFELESQLRAKEKEILNLKEDQSKAAEFLKNSKSHLPESVEKDPFLFESVDLNEEPDDGAKFESIDNLKVRVLELEGLIALKEDELVKFRQEKEIETESLRQRLFQLENILKAREEELGHLQKLSWDQNREKEVQELQKKTKVLEDFVQFKENEIYQIQMMKANQVQSLEQKIYDLENLIKTQSFNAEMQQQVLELQNLLKSKENECDHILSEKSKAETVLERNIQELKNLLSVKEEEISKLCSRLTELEKSYNDSKLEIERLLNEEKLNAEEKFVEPFQKNIQIPVAFEVEALSRTLNEEKQKSENLSYELAEKETLLHSKNEEIQILRTNLIEVETKMKKLTEEETSRGKVQLEQVISDLEKELESSNFQLSVVKRELEEFQNVKDATLSDLKTQLEESKNEFLKYKEKTDSEMKQLKENLNEKTKVYEVLLEEKEVVENEAKQKIKELERVKKNLEKEVEILKSVLASKEGDITTLALDLEQERSELANLKELLKIRQSTAPSENRWSQSRRFQEQGAQPPGPAKEANEGAPEVSVSREGLFDLGSWTEHELDELNTKLQSDLDTALYMLHQRDVRCDELTFELMQLLEERDTLQLRLSTALRINEELRALNKTENPISFVSLEESKDLEDQSNDRQRGKTDGPREDLRQLANKISELHSVSYLRDKTVKDDSVQRHQDQMSLLSRISDSDLSLTRDVQSSPAADWARGKSIPKVMHI